MNAPLFSEPEAAPVGEDAKTGKQSYPIFIHSLLDDYGLPPAAFRVYGHLARRAGSGAAYPSINSMAHICRLHPQTVRRALKLLVAQRLVLRESRPGYTTLYRLTPTSDWLPPIRMDTNHSGTNTPPSKSGRRLTSRRQQSPSENDVVEGNPNERNPVKAIQIPPLSSKGDNVTTTGFNHSVEEEIYAAYPKKVGRPAALQAIRRALKEYSSEFLVERTRLYASTYNGDSQYIPNPATWFREQRFNDDPATWQRNTSAPARPKPAIIRPANFECGTTSL